MTVCGSWDAWGMPVRGISIFWAARFTIELLIRLVAVGPRLYCGQDEHGPSSFQEGCELTVQDCWS